MDKTISLTPRQSAKLYMVCQALEVMGKKAKFSPLELTYYGGGRITLTDVYKQLQEQMK